MTNTSTLPLYALERLLTYTAIDTSYCKKLGEQLAPLSCSSGAGVVFSTANEIDRFFNLIFSSIPLGIRTEDDNLVGKTKQYQKEPLWVDFLSTPIKARKHLT
ncbi:hypothetical protein ElyMa_000798500 [Elysia marginata]|uniref:Uncharacterized protein n=1 Tax=Elysia marginata TaxID=1093978 RepID=A0AAV4GVR6_9GAST|nr:hypothetical protein ElyMa_000798500 [Elysia marginata]